MKVTITGGAGFLGVRLARELLRKSSLSLAGAPAQAISQLILVDRAAPPADLLADPRVAAVVGDLNAVLGSPAESAKALPTDVALVFHLAAAVSGECEADFDLGMRSNLAATHALLENCRALKTRPTVVFASSLAVFGKSDLLPTPAVLTDTTLPTPLTSYGIQKYIGEQLTADYGRKGFVRGRSVRLMTVSVRPGKPNGAASSFFSGMIREPLAGVTGVCPVPPNTDVALSSPATTIAGIIRAAEASDAEWGPLIALNLPALCTTTGEMAAALERVAGKAVADRIQWTPDPVIQKIVSTWPGRTDAARARGLGLLPDADFDSIIRDYILENPHAVTGTRPA
ncbi:D-erythronate dehydrogenase [Variovorax sp. HJSM1_2]|uniref:D-erythronate dehydrogenase n=1 Tax=Variovorax sp. HJSM1_2 TaxID=3366263 RepID=UPI003BE41C49